MINKREGVAKLELDNLEVFSNIIKPIRVMNK